MRVIRAAGAAAAAVQCLDPGPSITSKTSLSSPSRLQIYPEIIIPNGKCLRWRLVQAQGQPAGTQNRISRSLLACKVVAAY